MVNLVELIRILSFEKRRENLSSAAYKFFDQNSCFPLETNDIIQQIYVSTSRPPDLCYHQQNRNLSSNREKSGEGKVINTCHAIKDE